MSAHATTQGSLDRTPFAHVLSMIHQRQLSGTLAVWPDVVTEANGTLQDRILFEKGAPIAVRPSEPSANALDAITRVFTRTKAPYAFYENQDLMGTSEGCLHAELDPYLVLAHGVRTSVSARETDSLLSRIRGRKLRIRPGVPLGRLGLTKDERVFIDTLLAGPDSIENLVRSTPLGEPRAKRLLYTLTLIRGLEALPEGGQKFESLRPPTGNTLPPQALAQHAQSAIAAAAGRTGTGTARSSVAPIRASVPPPEQVSLSMPPGSLSAQEAALWKELSDTIKSADDLNYFQLLGLTQQSKPDEINQAYYDRVKRWHPDRLPAPLSPLLTHVRTLFEQLTEAHATLSVTDKRDAYVRTVSQGGGTRAAERMLRLVIESAMDFQKAEVLTRQKNYEQALEMVNLALGKNDAEADFHALHGYLTHMVNPTDASLLEPALAEIDKAVKAIPKSEKAHFYRGVVLRRMGKTEQAAKAFERVVELNPRNVEAAREVRIATMRSEQKAAQAAKPGGAGLLSRLFKKD